MSAVPSPMMSVTRCPRSWNCRSLRSGTACPRWMSGAVGVHAQLDVQGLAALQLLEQGGFGHDLRRAGFDDVQLFFGSEHRSAFPCLLCFHVPFHALAPWAVERRIDARALHAGAHSSTTRAGLPRAAGRCARRAGLPRAAAQSERPGEGPFPRTGAAAFPRGGPPRGAIGPRGTGAPWWRSASSPRRCRRFAQRKARGARARPPGRPPPCS